MGGQIIRGSWTLTFDGVLVSGPNSIFDRQTSTSGTVSFAKIPEYFFPEWWGANGDYSADDYYPCQACLDALSSFGGKGRWTGSYKTTQQLVTTGYDSKYFEIDFTGSAIRPVGAIYGIEVVSFSNRRGPVLRNLNIDQYNSDVTGSPGGILVHGAIAAHFENPIATVSSAALGTGRSSYIAMVIEPNGTFGSYWCVVEDFSCYVPDDTSGYIKAGIKITGNSNAVQLVRARIQSCEQGIRIESDNGDPNSVRITQASVETYSTAAVYILLTDGPDYNEGCVIDTLRCEPSNSGAYSVLVQIAGGIYTSNSNPLSIFNLTNVGSLGISVPSGMPYRVEP